MQTDPGAPGENGGGPAMNNAAEAFASAVSSGAGDSGASNIAMVDLRAQLEDSEAEWRQNLGCLFNRMQFVLGGQVAAFEREFAEAMGGGFAIGVGSGTSALELALRVQGITSSRQEVIVPALTSPFTAVAVRCAGATPVFADIDPERLLLDPEAVARRITRRTAAILPVHLYGQPCDMETLRRLARQSGSVLIQDACQAHGAMHEGKPLTAFPGCVAYSFYPTKNLGCLGDGGAVLTRSAAVAARLRMLRDGGRKQDQVSRISSVNSRLDEMQACFLRAALPRLAEWNDRRRRLAGLYDEALAGCRGVRPVARNSESVNHLYVIRTRRREALRRHLAGCGIATAVHYGVPVHLQPAFADRAARRGSLPVTERACREILSLPLHPFLAESAVLRVAESIREFFRSPGGVVRMRATLK